MMNRMRGAWRALTGKASLPQQRSEIRTIRPDEVEAFQHFFSRPKFFVFGHARSGTTLLARLLRLHPDVHCNWQGHFFSRPPTLAGLVADPEVEAWLTRRSNRWNQGRDLSPVVMRAVCDFVLESEAERLGKRIVGDKSPNNLLNGEAIRLLARTHPDARVIFIVRDGRDAIVSHRIQSFVDAIHTLGQDDVRIRQALLNDPVGFQLGHRSIFTERSLRREALSWKANLQETDSEGKCRFESAYASLRFEDLVDQPQETMSRLWHFLGAPVPFHDMTAIIRQELERNPDADWQHEKAGSMAASIPKGGVGSWRGILTGPDRQLFKELAGETLIEWGYEKDYDW